ncbi:hypothetical protein QE370_000463 [Aeromicrobium sp. SORGH_AS981]|uniref:hypothetical protein n=1 Tax=Aeromicrobium sp. SORGH_AS_0981 TaxID=3041802 RepID=UPI002866960D|nr:hypothetical protein [Aeromicrobium sp. SORGH_AS_0981]MDR6117279.1 hypothetical protein [Aeromicrobium sp. SORGH_AS_0981]
MEVVGKIVNVVTLGVGTALTVDHTAGATALTVFDGFEFDEDGGLLELGDDLLAYTGFTTDEEEAGQPDTILLATPLAADYEAGTRALVWPYSNATTAAVVIEETGEALEVAVPQQLVPTLKDGMRGDNGETVTVADDGGDWQIVSVEKDKVLLDGASIDPESTVPPAALTDGKPPTHSPEPTVTSFLGVLVARWPALDVAENPDPTSYEIHASPDANFVPSAATLADDTPGLLSYIRSTVGGGPLAYDTDYYVRIVAKDADGAAAPSAPIIGRASKVGLADIMAGAVTAEMLEAVLVLVSTIKLGSLIDISVPTTDAEGRPVGGIVVRDPANPTGVPLVQLHPLGCRFKGELVTDLLTILERAVINSQLILGPGSVTELQQGIPDPSEAPDVKTGPEARTAWPAVPTGSVERGITWDATTSTWWRLLWNATQKAIAVQAVNAAGEVTSNVAITTSGLDFVSEVSSIVRAGDGFALMVLEAFADGSRYWRIARYALGNNGARLAVTTYCPQADVAGTPAVGRHEGTSDLVVSRLTASNRRIYARPVIGNDLQLGNKAIEISTTFPAGTTMDGRATQIGSFDFGSATFWFAASDRNYFAAFPGWPADGSATSVAEKTTAAFPTDATISNGGAAWKPLTSGAGDRFYSTSADQILTQWSAYAGVNDQSWSILYADTNASGSTAASPVRTLTVPRRRAVTVTLPPPAKGVTGAAVWVGYAASGVATTFYRRSEALSASRSMILLGKSTSGSTSVPSTNTMGGTAALLRSQRQSAALGWEMDASGMMRRRTPVTDDADVANKQYVDRDAPANHSAWYRAAGQSIGDSSDTAYLDIAGTSADTTGAWTKASASPFGFTCQQAGVYDIVVSINWDAASAGRRSLVWELGGVVQPERTDMAPTGSFIVGQQVVISRRFTAGEVVAFRAFQTSGATRSVSKQRVTFTRKAA